MTTTQTLYVHGELMHFATVATGRQSIFLIFFVSPLLCLANMWIVLLALTCCLAERPMATYLAADNQ
jgi:hypothetical protein